MEFMHHDSWDDALFLHYEADPVKLQALLPPGLVVDTTRDGKAYVGVVALSEQGILPAILRLFPRWMQPYWLSMSHHAVNVRTYVRPISLSTTQKKETTQGEVEQQPGIYFFTLDCSHTLPALGARALFRLPYRLASMVRRSSLHDDGDQQHYSFFSRRRSILSQQCATLQVEWTTARAQEGVVSSSSPMSSLLMERYCLYNRAGSFLKTLVFLLCGKKQELWKGRITHQPWPVQIPTRFTVVNNTLFATIPGLAEAILSSPTQPPVAHFSPGVHNIRFFFETTE